MRARLLARCDGYLSLGLRICISRGMWGEEDSCGVSGDGGGGYR